MSNENMPTVYFIPAAKDNKMFFPLEVVGESKYQKNIKEAILYKIMVEKDDLKYKDEKLLASLFLEDENKFDPGNAVRVEIDNQVVGYLSKEDASEYRKQLSKLNFTDTIGTCQAAVYGSRPEEGKMMIFGVWLSLEPERGLKIGEAPVKKKGCFAPAAVLVISLLIFAMYK